jgi:hypothetical protein
MRGKIAALAVIAALVMGVLVFAAPSTSQAVTITSVSVTVGGTTWCDTTGSCANQIWDLGGGVLLFPASNSLVLTQTGGSAGFNFDTSEFCTAATPCAAPTITIGWLGGPVGGETFSDTAKVLAGSFNNGPDPVTNEFNEATNWVASGTSGSGLFNLNLAYADNIHTDICGDINANSGAGAGATTNNNCFPENPFSDATKFIGGGAHNNVFTDVSEFPNHCTPATTDLTCFDAGVLQIHGLETPKIPEPSTLLLLGVGLIGLASYGRRHLKKSA